MRGEEIGIVNTNAGSTQEKGLLKFIRGATSVPTTQVDDLGGLSYDRWKQVDLVGPVETNLAAVVGIAEHPTANVFELGVVPWPGRDSCLRD